MSCSFNENSMKCWADVLGDAQSVPRVDRTIGKYNIGSGDLSTSIVGIGGFDGLERLS